MSIRKIAVKYKALITLLVIIAFCIGWVLFARAGGPILKIEQESFIKNNSTFSSPDFVLNGHGYIMLDTYNSISGENINVNSSNLNKRLGILYWKEQSNLMRFRNFIFPDYIYSLKDYPDNKYVIRQSLLVGFKSVYVKSDINFNRLSAEQINTVVIKINGKKYACSDRKVINDLVKENLLNYKNKDGEKTDLRNEKYYITILFSFKSFPALYEVCNIYEDENGNMRLIDYEDEISYPVSDRIKNIINNYKDK